jgi:hypothetical protein
MTASHAHRAFQLFHAVLGLGLLAMGLTSLRYTLPELDEPGHGHFALVATLQALGAVLLLVPRTVRWGGGALLLVLLPGFASEALHGDWEWEQLILAAGVWFVMAHGAAWRSPPSTPTA